MISGLMAYTSVIYSYDAHTNAHNASLEVSITWINQRNIHLNILQLGNIHTIHSAG